MEDEHRKMLVKYARLFLIVFLACSVALLFFGQQLVVESSVVTEKTVFSMGLPSDMEKHAEIFARDSPVGTELDFGECSTVKKISNKEWSIKIC